MKCENFKIRTKAYKKYFYCKTFKKEILQQECFECNYKKIKKQKQIKSKSKKQAKLERKRFSILQQKNGHCFVCGKAFKNLDPHEAFGGCNRRKSIEHGLVYYICRLCHAEADINKELRQYLHDYAKEKFIEKYSEEKFLEEFKKNYIRRN